MEVGQKPQVCCRKLCIYQSSFSKIIAYPKCLLLTVGVLEQGPLNFSVCRPLHIFYIFLQLKKKSVLYWISNSTLHMCTQFTQQQPHFLKKFNTCFCEIMQRGVLRYLFEGLKQKKKSVREAFELSYEVGILHNCACTFQILLIQSVRRKLTSSPI